MTSAVSERVAVVGAGGWGTALAAVLARNGRNVLLWAREPEVVEDISRNRRNTTFLPGVALPDGIEPTGDLDRVKGSHAIVMAAPSHGIRGIASRIKGALAEDGFVVSVTKGFEVDTGLRASQVLVESLAVDPGSVCVLSGPSHAEEVGREMPTAIVAASTNASVATRTQKLFFSPRFRVYTHSDPVGVELGGALKNVIAIACGIGEGLGFGDNCQAALITRGLTEMTRLGCALGARRETFGGLAGIGDLVVTCTSRHSRNRAVGVRVGRGENLEAIQKGTAQVAEGVRAARGALRMGRGAGIAMPITEQVHAVLFEGREPGQALKELLGREARSEEEPS